MCRQRASAAFACAGAVAASGPPAEVIAACNACAVTRQFAAEFPLEGVPPAQVSAGSGTLADMAACSTASSEAYI